MSETIETYAPKPEAFVAGANTAFKDSFERSMSALTELNDHSRKNFEAVVASATVASKGAEALRARALAFSKKAVEDQLSAARTLASARSIQEVIELQTSFAKSAYEAYVAEAGKVAETVSSTVKDALSPINERVTALVERAQTVR